MFKPESEDGERKIRWAPTDEIARYWRISDDFLRHVLDLEPSWTFLSDLSTLHHFDIEAEVLEREIFLRYGIEVDDLEDRLLVDIFKRIEEEGIVPQLKTGTFARFKPCEGPGIPVIQSFLQTSNF